MPLILAEAWNHFVPMVLRREVTPELIHCWKERAQQGSEKLDRAVRKQRRDE